MLYRVVELDRRRPLHHRGDLRPRHQSRHRAGAGAEPRRDRAAATAGRRAQYRRHGDQELARPDDGRASLFARQVARHALHLELRDARDQGRAHARRRRRLDHRVRQPRLLDARLARPRSAAIARSDRERRRRLRLQGQNVQVASGVLNQPPMDKSGAFQISVQTLGRLTDPEEFGNIVVKQTAERGGAHEGRRAGRARGAGLLDQFLSRSSIRRSRSRSSSGRARTRCRPRRHIRATMESSPSASRRG